jgi:hypothetical protein
LQDRRLVAFQEGTAHRRSALTLPHCHHTAWQSSSQPGTVIFVMTTATPLDDRRVGYRGLRRLVNSAAGCVRPSMQIGLRMWNGAAPEFGRPEDL